ncbi:RNA polymerase sigma factor [Ferruginibacter sp. SUN106]|uniref:RNA polymerase sigma factor n=1 Tax=Ferruginibacter sp. SUN106 TaxID=2978348 RepID=UPI003D35B65E
MNETELIPHLFRTEYSKIVAVLCKLFGIEYMSTAEDIASDTFLLAAETWGLKGLPQNPTAWLYKVSKNKAIDLLRRSKLFTEKITTAITAEENSVTEPEIDLSAQNITDSQLQMMFAICHPCISAEAQIGLSLNILCGFGAEEIADAFLSNKETIYKRLSRAKEKLQADKVKIEMPDAAAINQRLETVLTTLYLLFSEGYYSSSQNTTLRKELCIEAMRLNLMLIENEQTNTPAANALLSLMCFHASRFDARINNQGEIILYEDQDENLWNTELINKGKYYLNKASTGNQLTKYHLEAAIAFWHTQKKDTPEKWENILQLYNKLLQVEYSPIAALNRTYALSKANGKHEAIAEAEKLNLSGNHLYHSLLGNLYTDINTIKAVHHFQTALSLTKSAADKITILKNISTLQ